jgi:UDP-N-acetylmuramoyl-tripeptide--D-alanyl-D-alanine ligase
MIAKSRATVCDPGLRASMPFTSRDFIHASGAKFLLGDPHTTFQGLSIDTRTLKKGDLFFAIPGPRHDGHDHLETAVQKGASGLVIQNMDERVRFDVESTPAVFQVPDSTVAIQQWARFLRNTSKATFIGITGSNGKTSTKEMLASILSRVGRTLATRGNLNNQLGLPLTLSQLSPDHRFVVLEMGASRPGDIPLLADIGRPHVGLITNIGKAHLEGLSSPEGVLKEKRALLDRLPSDGMAIINQDDPLLVTVAASLQCRKLFFGMTTLADVRADNIQEEDAGIRFSLIIRGQQIPVRLPVPGRFQVMNALAASAAAHAAGASLEDISLGLNAFQPVAMRMQAVSHPSGALLINDAYNANPSSVRVSIMSFSQGYIGRPKWLVLGDMRELGGEAASEHQALGVWLADQPIQRIFLYGRDTRFLKKALESKSAPIRVDRFKKKRLLVAELERSLAEKPVILFKGSRRMKLEDIINALNPAVLQATH